MKWGSTQLYTIKDTYIPPTVNVQINKIELIPGTDNTDPSNVIQQGGRGRYEVKFDGLVKTYAEYQSLETDYINGTSRTFYGADEFSEDMIISELTLKSRTLHPLMIIYSITLTEV